jgi:hypothetical protein
LSASRAGTGPVEPRGMSATPVAPRSAGASCSSSPRRSPCPALRRAGAPEVVGESPSPTDHGEAAPTPVVPEGGPLPAVTAAEPGPMPDLRTSTALRQLADLSREPDPPGWAWASPDSNPAAACSCPARPATRSAPIGDAATPSGCAAARRWCCSINRAENRGRFRPPFGDARDPRAGSRSRRWRAPRGVDGAERCGRMIGTRDVQLHGTSVRRYTVGWLNA